MPDVSCNRLWGSASVWSPCQGVPSLSPVPSPQSTSTNPELLECKKPAPYCNKGWREANMGLLGGLFPLPGLNFTSTHGFVSLALDVSGP